MAASVMATALGTHGRTPQVKRKASFKNLTEADVPLLCSHVNSYGRPSLDNEAPLKLAKERLPKELFDELGITYVLKQNVCNYSL